MVNLQKSGDFDTFAYFLAYRSGIKKAGLWLKQNRDKIQKMGNSIQSFK